MNIIEDFQALENPPKNQTQSLQKNLCDSVMTLSKISFLKMISSNFKCLVKELNMLTGYMRMHLKKQMNPNNIQQTSTEWKIQGMKGRSLLKGFIDKFQVVSSLQPMGLMQNSSFSDVLVFSPKKVDSAYSSHFGAIGSSGNEASLVYRPIPFNMTSEFP